MSDESFERGGVVGLGASSAGAVHDDIPVVLTEPDFPPDHHPLARMRKYLVGQAGIREQADFLDQCTREVWAEITNLRYKVDCLKEKHKNKED